MRKKILVADDDQAIRDLLQHVLVRAGYDVVLAEDGKSAVEKALKEKPDLVLTDGLLPKLHGFLAAKAIKEFEHPPKVVVMTGVYTKPNYRWQVKNEYHADDLLSKPFKIEELLVCIRTLIGNALGQESRDWALSDSAHR